MNKEAWYYNSHGALCHHGIKGQKWGEKNGPPYPLGSNNHSSREKKAGTKGWTKEAKQENKKKAIAVKENNSSQAETKKKIKHKTENSHRRSYCPFVCSSL